MYDDIITTYYKPGLDGLELARFRALISALSDEELCSFALNMLDGKLELKLRKFVEGKVVSSIASGKQPCHRQLISQLIEELGGSNFRYTQRAASILEAIAIDKDCSDNDKRAIFRSLLENGFVSHRKRAYKYSRTLNGASLEEVLVKNWRERGDWEATEVIVASFPPELLDQYYDELLADIVDNEYEEYVERRLYFRAPMNAARLQAILEKDEVTYACVCAKQKLPMPEATARRLWANRRVSGRPDLLIWAFGEAGLWNLLTELEL